MRITRGLPRESMRITRGLPRESMRITRGLPRESMRITRGLPMMVLLLNCLSLFSPSFTKFTNLIFRYFDLSLFPSGGIQLAVSIAFTLCHVSMYVLDCMDKLCCRGLRGRTHVGTSPYHYHECFELYFDLNIQYYKN